MNTTLRTLAGTALVCVGLAGAAAAQAQQMPPEEEEDFAPATRWQVTPFVGYRMGGDFDLNDGSTNMGSADLDDHGSFGLAVNLAIDESSAYELFYSRQATSFASDSPVAPFDLDVEYLHLGGTLLLSDQLPLAPYMVGGLGITRLSPKSGPGDDDTRASLSLGVGAQFPVTPRFGLRLEARGYVTLVDKDTAFFCASGPQGGVCAIAATGDTFFQFELLAGAVFKF